MLKRFRMLTQVGLASLVLLTLAGASLADVPYIYDAPPVELQVPVPQLEQQAATIAAQQATIAELTAERDKLRVDLAAAQAEIARLTQPAPPPPAPAAPTSVSFAPGSIDSRTAGDGSTLTLTTDHPLGPADDVLVLAWSDSQMRMVEGFAHALTDGPFVIPAAKLDLLPAGRCQVQVLLRRDLAVIARADRWIDVALPTPPPPPAATVGADSGPKTVVTNFRPEAGKTYRNLHIKGGIRLVWQSVNNVTFENCLFSDGEQLLVLQAKDDGSSNCSNWTLRDCSFVGATRSDWGHSHGAFLQGADNIKFINCLFKHNGWIGTQRFNQNHNVYLCKAKRITFDNCHFIEGAAQGIKMRGFERLEVLNCYFRGNLIDLGGDDRSVGGELIVKNCRFEDTGGKDSTGATLAWSINLEYASYPLNSVLIQDCSFKGPNASSNTRALKFSGGNLKKATMVRCDLSQWTGTKIVNEIGTRLSITE